MATFPYHFSDPHLGERVGGYVNTAFVVHVEQVHSRDTTEPTTINVLLLGGKLQTMYGDDADQVLAWYAQDAEQSRVKTKKPKETVNG